MNIALGAARRAAARPTVVLCGLLCLASLAWRTWSLDASFWIDEGISVGIAGHPLGEIPGLLAQDGSPPLYYGILHLWMRLGGDGEVGTHLLSLAFATLAIPAALWVGSALYGRRVGWVAAGLAAVSPFLNAYGQETRMYSLVALLGIAAAGSFVRAFVRGERRHLVVFAVALAALLYTHGWALFLVGGFLAALAVPWRLGAGRRRLARDAALAFGAAALAFSPWLPTLRGQAAETGAPWSLRPGPGDLLDILGLFGGGIAVGALLVGAGLGIARVIGARGDAQRAPTAALLVVLLTAALLAFAASLASPAWAGRYFAVLLGPLLLLAAVGVTRAGRAGAVALALLLVVGVADGFRTPDERSNVEAMATRLGPVLDPGDLVVSTQPEQVPVLDHYLPEGLRYASTLGPVPDPGVMDWRHAVRRLRDAGVRETLGPLLASVPPGGRLLLVAPDTRDAGSWRAPWTRLVRRRSIQWSRALARTPGLRRVAATGPSLGGGGTRVRAVLYVRAEGAGAPSRLTAIGSRAGRP